ncbi:MAG: hypothetical protein ACI9CD_000341 [Candidatus Deianiraeaceae bacterium]|jgi:hypothetical protein
MAFIWHNYGNISHYSYGIEKFIKQHLKLII